MANYQSLKTAINAVIKANGNKEITGTVLNEILLAIVNSLGVGYQFVGVATPSTNPGTPDQNVFYLAGQAGTYTNFNNIVIYNGVSILKWNGRWSSETVLAGDCVFDISAYKATGGTLATFADLSAALDGGNNIPQSLRKGGMSVKFVQSYDNKYVQYRLMSDTFNVTIDNWQIVDELSEKKGIIELASYGVFLQYDNKNAAGSIMANRLRSDKIFVEPNTTYVVEKKFGYNATERCSIARYDEDDTLVQDSDWIDERTEFQTTNESYIRIVYKYDDTENVVPYNVIPGYIIRKTDTPILSAVLIPAIPNYFKNGTIGSNGQIVSSGARLVSGLINVDKTAAVNVTCNSSYLVSFATYDKNKNFIEWTLSYQQSRLNYAFNDNVGYIRLVVMPNPDGSISPQSIMSSDLSITSSVIGNSYLNKLTVGLWNCGLYHGGLQPAGIPNDELDATLPGVRELITNIGADVLVIQEDPTSGKIDANGTISTYDALYKQFYPYHAQIGWWMTVYSKFPIAGKVLRSVAEEHRAFFVGYININGVSVKFCAVHFSPYNSSDRVTEAEQMAAYMDNYDKCILVGDLNTSNDETEATAELKPFRDKGFTLANRGYWGAKVTYPNGSYKIDNIITKGINIDNFTVIEDTSVSDHYPVCSQISF